MNQTISWNQVPNKAIVSMGYDNIETNITLSQGHGSIFPDPSFVGPYNIIWWNASDYSNPTNDQFLEIVQCIAKIGDTLVVMRSQQQTQASPKNIYGKLYSMMPFPGGDLKALSYYNVPPPHTHTTPSSGGALDHTNLTNIGTHTHSAIDTHLDALGTMSVQSAGSVTITGGTITGITSMGIGTTSPLVKLHVDGISGTPATTGTTQTGSLRIGNSSNNEILDMGAVSGYSWIQSADKTNLGANFHLAINPNGGNVGININPNVPFQVGLSANTAIGMRFDTINQIISSDNAVGGYLALGIQGSPLTLNDKSGGNVGIGTSSPSAKLDVRGSLSIGTGNLEIDSSAGDNYWIRSRTDTPNPNFNIGVGNGSGGWSHTAISWNNFLDFRGGGTANPAHVRITSTGNVGIGTASPTTPLHIIGIAASGLTIQNTASVNNNIAITHDSANALIGWETGDLKIGTETDPAGFADFAPKLTILNGGNVGIGTTVPTGELHISASEPALILTNTMSNDGDTILKGYQDAAGFTLTNNIAEPTSNIFATGTTQYTSRDGIYIRSQQGTGMDSNTFLQIGFQPAGIATTPSTKLHVNGLGNVGIGTSPTAKLHIGGTPGTDGIKFPDGTLQTTAATGGAGYELTANKNVASGYAGLDGLKLITPARIPVDLPHTVAKINSANLRHTNPYSMGSSQYAGYERVLTTYFTNGIKGTLRIDFSLGLDPTSYGTAYGKIYKRVAGVATAIGTERTTTAVWSAPTTFSENINVGTLNPQDSIEIWAHKTNPGNQADIMNFKIYYDDAPSVTVAASYS